MMVPHDGHHIVKQGDGGKYLGTFVRMLLYVFIFLVIQLVRLHEYFV